MYFHHNLSPWDVASGLLLVTEAGGIITDKHGNPGTLYSEGIIASGAELHAEFLRATDGLAWRR